MKMLKDFYEVVFWAMCWWFLYKFANLKNPKYSAEYSCRVATLTHAIILTALTFYVLFLCGTSPFETVGFPSTPQQNKLLACSLGYFLFDMGWCIVHKTEGLLMLIHHVVSISAMTYALLINFSAVEMLGVIFGSEPSSIFLNIRWFLKYTEQYEHTTIGIATDIIFVFLFISIRIFLGGYFAYCTFISHLPSFLVKLAGVLMYSVNLFFLVHVLSFARYRTFKLLARSKVNSKVTITNGHSDSNGTVKQTKVK